MSNIISKKNNDMDIILKDSVHISKEQRKQMDEFYEMQKKLGLNKEKGANYTLKHPFDRSIQSDFEKESVHKPPFYFNRF